MNKWNTNVELVNIRWLQQWAGFPPTKMTPDSLYELMKDILYTGITDPALLIVNPITKEIRLDSGNHRVYLLPLLGITKLPVICFVTNDTVVLSATNGTHVYTTDCITADQNFTAGYYCRPSKAVDVKHLK